MVDIKITGEGRNKPPASAACIIVAGLTVICITLAIICWAMQ